MTRRSRSEGPISGGGRHKLNLVGGSSAKRMTPRPAFAVGGARRIGDGGGTGWRQSLVIPRCWPERRSRFFTGGAVVADNAWRARFDESGGPPSMKEAEWTLGMFDGSLRSIELA
jgi:hypothetical protein